MEDLRTASSLLHLPGPVAPPPYGGAGGYGECGYAAPPSRSGLPTGAGYPAAQPPQPAVFFTAGSLTLSDSPPRHVQYVHGPYSPPSSVYGGHGAYTGPALRQQQQQPSHALQQQQQQQQQEQLEQQVAYIQQLELHNADLMRQCQELQAQLEAAEREAPRLPAPTSACSPGAGAAVPGGDLEEEARLRRRLDAKQREAEAAAQALAAKQRETVQREAELEQERARVAALADDVAGWKDECTKKERLLKALQQRLEAATTHASMLDDSAAALKKRNAELGTALAQRDVTIRQLEDRLRSLKGSEGSREKQLEAMHDEREALRRDNSTLKQKNRDLSAEVQRLDAALAQAKEQVAGLERRSRELELAALHRSTDAALAPGSGSKGQAQQQAGACRRDSSSDVSSSSNGALEAGADAAQGPAPGWQRRDRYALPSTANYQPPPPGDYMQHDQLGQPYPYSQAAGPEPDYYGSHPALAGAHGWPSGPPPDSRGTDVPYGMLRQQQQEQPWDPRASLPQPYAMPPPQHHQLAASQQQWQQTPEHWQLAEATLARTPVSQSQEMQPPRSALQRYNQPTFVPPPHGSAGWYGKPAAAAADGIADGDTCSVSSYSTGCPGAGMTPVHAWQRYQGPGGTGSAPDASTPRPQQRGRGTSDGGLQQQEADVQSLVGQMEAIGLQTPSSGASPFGTDETLQDMLARTKALEDQLLRLNAEKNELEAESARMPTHTAGRTLQERKRRAEVERRLEAVNRECSNVRLQLRRLGVK